MVCVCVSPALKLSISALGPHGHIYGQSLKYLRFVMDMQYCFLGVRNHTSRTVKSTPHAAVPI